MSINPAVSVIVPMFNESELIQKNIARLCVALDRTGDTAELIVVNDGSTDDTLEKGLASANDDSRVRMVGYKENRGRGFAIKYGIQQARGSIVVVTEGDLSYGDDIVERLTVFLRDGEYDCVVASPHTKGGGMENVPLNRAFFTKAGNWVLRILMPVHLGTYTGMTRAYRRDVIQSLDLESNGKELHLEIIAKLGSLGYRIGEMPAVLAWPTGRKTRKGTFAPWRIIASHLSFGVGEAPLLLLGSAGLLFIALGVVLGIYLLALSISGETVGGRPMVTFAPLCILVGFFILLIGWLGQQNKQLQRQFHRIHSDLLKLSATNNPKHDD